MKIEDIEFIQDYGIFQKGVKLDFSNRVDNFIALVGLSGSGKTTLVNLMAKVFGHELMYSWKWCSDIKKIYNEVCKSYNNLDNFLLEDKAKKFIDKEETKMYAYLSKVEEYWSRAITDNMKTTPYSDKINKESFYRGINSIYFLQSNFINIAIASLSLLKESEIDLFLSKNNIKFDFNDNFNFKLYENIRIDNVSSGNAVFNNEIAKTIYENYRIKHDNDIRINDLLFLIEIEDNPEFRSQFGNSKFDFSIVNMRTPKDKAKILFKFLWSVYYQALSKLMAKQFEDGSIANSSHDWLSIDFFTYMNSSVIENLSEGQKKFLILTLIFKVLADENSLILLDEVDVHLDSKLKSMIFKMIKECKGQVILTTHDPVMVSNMPPENVFMLENGKISENQSFARALAETDNCNMLDALGMQGKPYIVVVEGPSDLKIIQRTIEILSNSGKHKQAGSESKDYKDLFENVIFLNLGGTGNIEHFFKDTLPYYMKTNVKKILFLFDRDEAGYNASHIVEKEKKNNNIYDFYLYCEPGKTENDYNTNASHKNCENLFYLEDYVPLDSIEVEGRKATFWDNGKQIPFHVLKDFEDGKKSANKKQDPTFVGPVSFVDGNGIVNNLKIKFEDGSYFSGDITRSKITSIVSSIKNQILNKTDNNYNYNYYRNFKYLVDDILDKLFLSDEEYKVRHCKLYKNEVNNPYNADCIEDMILWETERKMVSASFSQLDKYKEILNKVKDKIGITELDINNPLWSCMYNVIESIKFENGCKIFDCSDKQIEQFRKMYETNNHLVI